MVAATSYTTRPSAANCNWYSIKWNRPPIMLSFWTAVKAGWWWDLQPRLWSSQGAANLIDLTLYLWWFSRQHSETRNGIPIKTPPNCHKFNRSLNDVGDLRACKWWWWANRSHRGIMLNDDGTDWPTARQTDEVSQVSGDRQKDRSMVYGDDLQFRWMNFNRLDLT